MPHHDRPHRVRSDGTSGLWLGHPPREAVEGRHYSYLNATIGSTQVTRRAGRWLAMSTTIARITATAANVSGSAGFTLGVVTRGWARRALLGFQQLDAGGGEGEDGFEHDRCTGGIVREVQPEGGVFLLDAVFEDANCDS